jgi:hypothetical protein
MTNDSKLFIQRDKAEADGFRPDIYGRWVNDAGEVLLPLYEGRMIGQFDFSEKGWVSGKGRGAKWREISWEDKRIEPQYLMREEDAARSKMHRGPKIAYMRIGSATNSRTVVSTYLRDVPAGDSVFFFLPSRDHDNTALSVVAQFGTFAYDWSVRARLGGLNLSEFLMVETPLVPNLPDAVRELSLRLVASGSAWFAHEWQALSKRQGIAWHRLWALTPSERLRLRCMLDAIVAVLFGLDRADFSWLLKDCDHPKAALAEKAFCRRLDAKGFWRVNKDQDPELRHPVLSLVAFDHLLAMIEQAGDREAGIRDFCDQNGGDGWMLPEELCLADLGLARTVEVGEYDDCARSSQPVRSRMGERFLEWQLAQTPEESWAECERHARILSESLPAPAAAPRTSTEPGQPSLFGDEA